MSENPTPPGGDAEGHPEDPPAKRLRLRHREEQLARHYANAFRTFTSAEELVVDFGFNLVRMDAAAAEASGADGSVEIDWNQRTVLSFRTAKTLAMDLARIIREHERAHGEIPVQASVQAPVQAPPPAPGPGRNGNSGGDAGGDA